MSRPYGGRSQHPLTWEHVYQPPTWQYVYNPPVDQSPVWQHVYQPPTWQHVYDAPIFTPPEPLRQLPSPQPPTLPPSILNRSAEWLVTRLPGLGLAVPIAGVATVVGGLVPVISAPVVGIVIGVIIAAVRRPGAAMKPGITFASKFVLQLSVVLMGAQLSLQQAFSVGASSLPVMIGTLVICLAAAWGLGRLLHVSDHARTLVGVGTGICGASAIAAVTPVIGAAGADVAAAVSTIFLFNVAAVLTFPMIGHMLAMGQHAFGLFAGTAVNDTSSVVAAATAYGSSAANYAIMVKLTRTLLIIPICFGLAALTARRSQGSGASAVKMHTLVPWFLIGFLVMAAGNSAGIVPSGLHHPFSVISSFLITVALSGIGLSTDLPALRAVGIRPVVLGAVLWVLVASTSLALQYLTSASLH